MSNDLTWAPPSYFQPSNSDPSWIRTIKTSRYPDLYTKKNEKHVDEISLKYFKLLGEFWIKWTSITRFLPFTIVPIAVSLTLWPVSMIVCVPTLIFFSVIAIGTNEELKINRNHFKKCCLIIEEKFSNIKIKSNELYEQLKEIKEIENDQERFNKFKKITENSLIELPKENDLKALLKALEQWNYKLFWTDQHHQRDLSILNLWMTSKYTSLQRKLSLVSSANSLNDVNKCIVGMMDDCNVWDWARRFCENVEVVRLSC